MYEKKKKGKKEKKGKRKTRSCVNKDINKVIGVVNQG